MVGNKWPKPRAATFYTAATHVSRTPHAPLGSTVAAGSELVGFWFGKARSSVLWSSALGSAAAVVLGPPEKSLFAVIRSS